MPRHRIIIRASRRRLTLVSSSSSRAGGQQRYSSARLSCIHPDPLESCHRCMGRPHWPQFLVTLGLKSTAILSSRCCSCTSKHTCGKVDMQACRGQENCGGVSGHHEARRGREVLQRDFADDYAVGGSGAVVVVADAGGSAAVFAGGGGTVHGGGAGGGLTCGS